MPYNTKKIRHVYKSKHNLNLKSKVIFLIITDNKKQHYLPVKKVFQLLRGITSKYVEDHYCLNCLHSFRTENKLKEHRNVCENHNYCHKEMPKEDKEVLKYNHGEKSMKVPFIVYADLESLLEKISTCHNNPKSHQQLK